MFEFQILSYDLTEEPLELSVELISQDQSLELFRQESLSHVSTSQILNVNIEASITVPSAGTLFIKFAYPSHTSGVLFSTDLLSQISTQYFPIFSPPKQLEYLDENIENPRVLIVNPQNEENIDDFFSNFSFQLYQKFVDLKTCAQRDKVQMANELRMLEFEGVRYLNEANLQRALKDDKCEELDICEQRKAIIKNNMEVLVADLEAQREMLEEQLALEGKNVERMERLNREIIQESMEHIDMIETEEIQLNLRNEEYLKIIERLKVEKLKAEQKVSILECDKEGLTQMLNIEQLRNNAKSFSYEFYAIFAEFVKKETNSTVGNFIDNYEDIVNNLQEKYNISLMELQTLEEKLRISDDKNNDLGFKYEEILYKKKEIKNKLKQDLNILHEKFLQKSKNNKDKKGQLKGKVLELIGNNENLTSTLKNTVESCEARFVEQERQKAKIIEEYESRISEMTQVQIRLKIESEELVHDLSVKLIEQASQSEKEKLDLKIAHDTKLSSLQKSYEDSLKAFESEMQSQSASYESTIQTSNNSISALQNELSSHKTQIELLSFSKVDLETQIEATKRLLETSRSALQLESETRLDITNNYEKQLEELKRNFEKQTSIEKEKSEESHKLLEYEIKQLRSELLTQEQEKNSISENLSTAKDFFSNKIAEIENENFVVSQKLIDLDKKYKQDIAKERSRFEDLKNDSEAKYCLLEDDFDSMKTTLHSEIDHLNKKLNSLNELRLKDGENYSQIIQEIKENMQLELQRTEMNYEIISKELENQINSLNRVLLENKMKYEKEVEKMQIEYYRLQELKQMGENEMKNEFSRLQESIKEREKHLRNEYSKLQENLFERENKIKAEIDKERETFCEKEAEMKKECFELVEAYKDIERKMKSDCSEWQEKFQEKENEMRYECNKLKVTQQEREMIMKKEFEEKDAGFRNDYLKLQGEYEDYQCSSQAEIQKLRESIRDTENKMDIEFKELQRSFSEKEIAMQQEIQITKETFIKKETEMKTELNALENKWNDTENNMKNELIQLTEKSVNKEKQLQSEFDKLQEKIHTMANQYEELSKSENSLKNKYIQLQESEKSLHSELEKLNQIYKTTESSLLQEIKTLQKSSDNTKSLLQSECDALSLSESKLKSELANLQHSYQFTESKLSELKQAYQDKEKSYQSEIVSLKQACIEKEKSDKDDMLKMQQMHQEKEITMKIEISKILKTYQETETALKQEVMKMQELHVEKETAWTAEISKVKQGQKEKESTIIAEISRMQKSYQEKEASFKAEIAKVQEMADENEKSLRKVINNLQEEYKEKEDRIMGQIAGLEEKENKLKSDLVKTQEVAQEKENRLRSDMFRLQEESQSKENLMKVAYSTLQESFSIKETNMKSEFATLQEDYQASLTKIRTEYSKSMEIRQIEEKALREEFAKLQDTHKEKINNMRSDYYKLQELCEEKENKLKIDYDKLLVITQERERVIKSEYTKLQEAQLEREKQVRSEYTKLQIGSSEREKELQCKYDSEIAIKNAENCNLKNEISNLDSRIKELLQKIAADQSLTAKIIRDFEVDRNELHDRVYTLEKEVSSLEIQKDTNQRAFNEYKLLKEQEESNYKQEYTATLQSTSRDLDHYKSSLSASKQQESTLTEQIKATEAVSALLKSKYKSKLSLLKQEVSDSASLIAALQGKISQLEAKIQELEKNSLEKELAFKKESQSFSLDMNHKVKALQETIRNLNSQIENNQSVITEYTDKLQFILKECESHSQAYAEMKSKNSSLEEAVEILRDSLRKKSEEIESMEQVVQSTKAEKKNSNKEILSILSSHNPSDPETVDKMLNAYLLANNTTNNFIRIADGVYSHKNKKVGVCIKNGSLVIRVGGGYMFIDEFLRQHVDDTTEPNLLSARRSYEIKKTSLENNTEDCVYDFSNPINGLSNSLHLPKNSCKTPIKRIV